MQSPRLWKTEIDSFKCHFRINFLRRIQIWLPVSLYVSAALNLFLNSLFFSLGDKIVVSNILILRFLSIFCPCTSLIYLRLIFLRVNIKHLLFYVPFFFKQYLCFLLLEEGFLAQYIWYLLKWPGLSLPVPCVHIVEQHWWDLLRRLLMG